MLRIAFCALALVLTASTFSEGTRIWYSTPENNYHKPDWFHRTEQGTLLFATTQNISAINDPYGEQAVLKRDAIAPGNGQSGPIIEQSSDSSGHLWSNSWMYQMNTTSGKIMPETGCFLNTSNVRSIDIHPITGQFFYVGRMGWVDAISVHKMDPVTCEVTDIRRNLVALTQWGVDQGFADGLFDADGRFWGSWDSKAAEVHYWKNDTAKYGVCQWSRSTVSYYSSGLHQEYAAAWDLSTDSYVPLPRASLDECFLVVYYGNELSRWCGAMVWWPGRGMWLNYGDHIFPTNMTYNMTVGQAEEYDFHNETDFHGPPKNFHFNYLSINGWTTNKPASGSYTYGAYDAYGYVMGNWTSMDSISNWYSSSSVETPGGSPVENPRGGWGMNAAKNSMGYTTYSWGLGVQKGQMRYECMNGGVTTNCPRFAGWNNIAGNQWTHRGNNTFWTIGRNWNWNNFEIDMGQSVSWMMVNRINPIDWHPDESIHGYAPSSYYKASDYGWGKPVIDIVVSSNWTNPEKKATNTFHGIGATCGGKNPLFYAMDVEGNDLLVEGMMTGASGVSNEFHFGLDAECDNPWDANGCARRKLFTIQGEAAGVNANRIAVSGIWDHDSNMYVDAGIVSIDSIKHYTADMTCPGMMGKPTGASIDVHVHWAMFTQMFSLEVDYHSLPEGCNCSWVGCDTMPMGEEASATLECDFDGTVTACSHCKPGWVGDACETDDEDPVVVCPADVTVNDTDQYHAVDGFRNRTTHEIYFDGPVVTDNSDGLGFAAPIVTASHMSGTNFSFGWNEVVYTATDHAGNVGSCSFYVIVVDNTPPMLDCPMDFVQGTDVDSEVATLSYDITVLDNVAHDAQVDNGTHILNVTLEVWANAVPGDSLSIGDHAVYISATDYSNNTATCAFVVTIADQQAPVAVCPEDFFVNTDSGFDFASGLMFEDTMLSSDNVGITDGSAVFSADETTQFPAGSNVVTFNVSDDAGNVGSCTFTVEVTDLCAGINCNSPPNDCHVTAGAHCYDGVCDYPDADFRSTCMDGISEVNRTLYREFICVEGECYPDPWTYLGNGSFGAHFGPSGSIVGALMAFFALAVPAFFF